MDQSFPAGLAIGQLYRDTEFSAATHAKFGPIKSAQTLQILCTKILKSRQV